MPGIVFPQPPSNIQRPQDPMSFAGGEMASFFRNFNEARGQVLSHQTRTFALEQAFEDEVSSDAYTEALMAGVDQTYGELAPEDQADLAAMRHAMQGISDPRQAQKMQELFEGKIQNKRNLQRATDLAGDIEEHAEDGVFGETEGAAAIYGPILEILADPNQRAMLSPDEIDAFEGQIQQLIEKEADRRDRVKMREDYAGRASGIVDQLAPQLYPEEVRSARALATMMETAPVELIDDIWEQFIEAISGSGRKKAAAAGSVQDRDNQRLKFIQDRMGKGQTADEAIDEWRDVEGYLDQANGDGDGTVKFESSGDIPNENGAHTAFIDAMVDVALTGDDPEQDSSDLLDQLEIGELSKKDAVAIQAKVKAARKKEAGPEPKATGALTKKPKSVTLGRDGSMRADIPDDVQPDPGQGPAPAATGEASKRAEAEKYLSEIAGKPVTLTKAQHRTFRRELAELLKKSGKK